jgi:hypothetical protein
MTPEGQLDIFDAISEPIAGDTKATVELVAGDWRPSADLDWRRFEAACRDVALWHGGPWGHVDPNLVRSRLTDESGLTIDARRYSAFWHRAASKNGFLVADGWVTNTDHAGGNAGKPLRRYRLREAT